MNCREVAELLIDYVSDEMPLEQRERLKQHLCQCPPCVLYLETYQTTIRVTRQLPDVPMPPALVAKLRLALNESREC